MFLYNNIRPNANSKRAFKPFGVYTQLGIEQQVVESMSLELKGYKCSMKKHSHVSGQCLYTIPHLYVPGKMTGDRQL